MRPDARDLLRQYAAGLQILLALEIGRKIGAGERVNLGVEVGNLLGDLPEPAEEDK